MDSSLPSANLKSFSSVSFSLFFFAPPRAYVPFIYLDSHSSLFNIYFFRSTTCGYFIYLFKLLYSKFLPFRVCLYVDSYFRRPIRNLQESANSANFLQSSEVWTDGRAPLKLRPGSITTDPSRRLFRFANNPISTNYCLEEAPTLRQLIPASRILHRTSW